MTQSLEAAIRTGPRPTPPGPVAAANQEPAPSGD